MTNLADEHCEPVPAGSVALSLQESARLLTRLFDGWELGVETRHIVRTFHFEDFHETMIFVNEVARIANREDHHPTMEVQYGSCRIQFDTHTVGGLSRNDFICAAQIDRL